MFRYPTKVYNLALLSVFHVRHVRGTCEILFQFDLIIDYFRLSGKGVVVEEGGRGICYRYPTKGYNLTQLSAQVFDVRV